MSCSSYVFIQQTETSEKRQHRASIFYLHRDLEFCYTTVGVMKSYDDDVCKLVKVLANMMDVL